VHLSIQLIVMGWEVEVTVTKWLKAAGPGTAPLIRHAYVGFGRHTRSTAMNGPRAGALDSRAKCIAPHDVAGCWATRFNTCTVRFVAG